MATQNQGSSKSSQSSQSQKAGSTRASGTETQQASQGSQSFGQSVGQSAGTTADSYGSRSSQSQSRSQGASQGGAQEAGQQQQTQGAQTSQRSNMNGSNALATNAQFSGNDVIRDTLVNAVGSFVQTFEPQINDFSARMAHQAVDRSKDLVAAAYTRVQRQPWYLVGIGALLLIGAAVMIGYGENESLAASAEPDFSH